MNNKFYTNLSLAKDLKKYTTFSEILKFTSTRVPEKIFLIQDDKKTSFKEFNLLVNASDPNLDQIINCSVTGNITGSNVSDAEGIVNINTIGPEEGERSYDLTCSDSYDYTTITGNTLRSINYLNISLEFSPEYLVVNMPINVHGDIEDDHGIVENLSLEFFINGTEWFHYSDWFNSDWKYRIPICRS